MAAVGKQNVAKLQRKPALWALSLWAVPCFLLLLALGNVVQNHLIKPLYYGGFTVDSGKGSLLQFMRQGDASLRRCQLKTSQVVSVYRSLCPTCKVAQTPCSNSPSDSLLESLSEAPIDFPSARTADGGVLVYFSENSDESLSLCEQTAKANPDLKCLKPGQVRPLPAGEFSAREPGMRADRLVSKVQWALGLLMVIAVGALYLRKRLAKLQFAKGQTLQKLIFAMSDFASIALAYYTVGLPDAINPVSLYEYDLRQVALQMILGLAVAGWLWVHYQQYTRRRPLWDELNEQFKTLVAATLISATALFYSEVNAARNLNILAWGFCFLLVPVGRIATRQILDVFGLWKRPVLIVGTGPNAVDAFKAICSEFSLGYQVIGFVETDADTLMQSTYIEVQQQLFKKYRYGANFKEVLNKLNNPQLVLALESLATTSAQNLLHKISLLSNDVHVIPSLRGLPLFGAQMSHFFSHEVVFLTVRNNLSRRSYQIIKRSFDLLFASVGLLILSPVLLIIVFLVKQDGGDAFYSHLRIGKDGKSFRCLKFRSMHVDAEQKLSDILASDPAARAEWEKDFKLRNDPRITKIGQFLRKTSMDELPQLINVLKLEMSLVGPRPVTQSELGLYGSSRSYYLSALPGITGLWQVSGRNDTTYKERVALDTWYVQNWSMWYDIAILVKTVGVVFRRKGAY